MAAFGGSCQAQSEIGYCYEYGQGVVRNIKEAVSWYEMASARGILKPRTTWHSAIRRAEAYIRMSKRPFDSMEKPQRAVMPVHSTIWVIVTGTARA